MTNIGCDKCTFTNFQQNYWVYVLNESSAPISNVAFPDNVVKSLRGNMSVNQSGDIHYPAIAFSFRGQLKNPGGRITAISITNLDADATWIKSAVAFWEGVDGAVVRDTSAKNCGQHTGPDRGGYCLFAYQGDGSGEEPTNIQMSNIKLTAPFSAGIYTATASRLTATNINVTGQIDAANKILPKAAVALNQCANCTLNKFVGVNNLVGIDVSGDVGSTINIIDPVITSDAAGSVGIRVQPNGHSDSTTATNIMYPAIKLTGGGSVGLFFLSSSASTKSPGLLTVSGGTIEASAYGIQAYDANTKGSAIATGLSLKDLTIRGRLSVAGIVFASTSTPLTEENVTIDCSRCAPGAIKQNLSGARSVRIDEPSSR